MTPNYAIKPTPELALRSNRSLPPARLIAALDLMTLPVGTSWIHLAEEELGFVLPNWLRERLSRANGGSVEAAGENWELFPVFDRTDRRSIRRTCNSVVLETRVAKEWLNFPEVAVAIAKNGGGDLLILLPEKNDPERLGANVYLWAHDTDDPPLVVDVTEN